MKETEKRFVEYLSEQVLKDLLLSIPDQTANVEYEIRPSHVCSMILVQEFKN